MRPVVQLLQPERKRYKEDHHNGCSPHQVLGYAAQHHRPPGIDKMVKHDKEQPAKTKCQPEHECCQPGEKELPDDEAGDTGNTGDTGDTGDTGNTGDTGDTGDTGNTGNTGEEDELSADEYEPNDSRSESTQVALETDIEATIYPAGDVDFYVFDTENTDYWDKIEILINNVSEDLDVEIKVYDEDGVELSGQHAGTRGANLSYVMESPGGTYFLRVESRWSNDVGAYTLNVKNLHLNDEYAPNDTRNDSTDLGILPAEDVNGVIVSSEEEDWYKFKTENDVIFDYVQFDITDVADGLEASLSLYNADGNDIFSVNSGAKGANLRHTLVTPGGIFYARVTSYWSDPGTGEYKLEIKNLHANDEYEPNDTRSTAYDLGTLPVSDINGMIVWTTGDEDWFKFKTTSSDPFTISITDVGEELQVNLRIEDEPGNSHTVNSGNKGADLIISSNDMTYISPDNDKTIYIRIQGRYSNHRGAYKFSVTH